jgi:hypothetical protein
MSFSPTSLLSLAVATVLEIHRMIQCACVALSVSSDDDHVLFFRLDDHVLDYVLSGQATFFFLSGE